MGYPIVRCLYSHLFSSTTSSFNEISSSISVGGGTLCTSNVGSGLGIALRSYSLTTSDVVGVKLGISGCNIKDDVGITYLKGEGNVFQSARHVAALHA